MEEESAWLQLPTDGKGIAARSGRLDHVPVDLSRGTVAGLRLLSRGLQLPLSLPLLGGWAVLLARLSGQDEVLIGTGMHPVRVVLRGNPTVEQLLQQLRGSGAQSRSDRFHILVGGNHAARDQTRFDLAFSFEESDSEVRGSVAYDTGVFESATIERWAGQFRVVLKDLVEDPHCGVMQLKIMTAAEREQVVVGFNDTSVDADPGSLQLIHRAFEAQVDRTPVALAVIHEDESLTYRELNQKANRVAWYLRGQGVTAESLVGVFMERGVDMLVAVLGIWKAGGAYLPLDPADADARLASMLEDASPVVLLTHDRLRARLCSSRVRTISFDDEIEELASQEGANATPASSSADNAAYVIYTSGSTGKPKGVIVEHRNVMNLWRALERRIYRGFGPQLRIGVNASLAFDASVKQILQLLSGRTLCIVPSPARVSATQFVRFLEDHRVDGFDCTPSQLGALADAGLFRTDRRIPKLVLVGGEAIDAGLWRTMASHPHISFFNVYGPTECTVDATVARVADHPGSPVIGTPIDNVRIYLLDGERCPVPIGVVGEIHIAGAGVGRGYLNRPELTAERFIPDPFTTAGRLYRTGDLARWRSNGTIEYVGRNDHQIKMRGYRFEPAEIEAHLLDHPGVAEAVVVAREDVPGDKTLTACVVADFSRLKQRHGDNGCGDPELVSEWKAVHDKRYASADPGPSFVGWNSSYTGEPIPDAQMDDWLSRTVERIRGLAPRRVLEIGCGTGLLVAQLAPRCEVYRATDLSLEAIRGLRIWLGRRPDLRHVRLEQCSALQVGVLRRRLRHGDSELGGSVLPGRGISARGIGASGRARRFWRPRVRGRRAASRVAPRLP